MRVALGIAALLAFVLYCVALHTALLHPNGRPYAAAGVLVPMLFFAALWLWHQLTARLRPTARVLTVGVFLAVCSGLIGLFWREVTASTDGIYLLQHVGTMGFLAGIFAFTLRPGHEPLVTLMARKVHGELPPPIGRYTRQLTVSWSLLFVGIAVASIGLYLVEWRAAWSALVNLLTWPIIALGFVGEYAYRRWRFPDFEHVDFKRGWQAWQERRS